MLASGRRLAARAARSAAGPTSSTTMSSSRPAGSSDCRPSRWEPWLRTVRTPDAAEAGQRRLGPPSALGAAHRPGQDRDARARQPRALNGGDELDGRFADQSHGGRPAPVQQPRGDALGQPVHLGPGVAVPGRGLAVEHHQIAGAAAHRGRQRRGQLTHRGVWRRSRPAGRRPCRSSGVPLRTARHPAVLRWPPCPRRRPPNPARRRRPVGRRGQTGRVDVEVLAQDAQQLGADGGEEEVMAQ